VRHNECVAFRLDQPRFETLSEAFKYLLSEYAAKEHPLYPGKEPAFIFRGENGVWPTTKPSIARVTDGLTAMDARILAEMSDWAAARLQEELGDLTRVQAAAQMQHYGMPSSIVDFSGDLGQAVAFAGAGESDCGRLAVLPYKPIDAGPLVRLCDHPWAERAQRQAAYGVLMNPYEIADLKADSVRERLDIRWFEFGILPEEREFCKQQRAAVLRESNDASGGFVRHYITRYVEAHKKLSPSLTDWLSKHIVIAPYCALVDRHEGDEAVVYFRSAECLFSFDRELEIEASRRYWSDAYCDDSRDRLVYFVMPPAGQVFVDPRTFHSENHIRAERAAGVS
jgi:hypothetical protein